MNDAHETIEIIRDMIAGCPDAESASVRCSLCGVTLEFPVTEIDETEERLDLHLTVCPRAPK